VLTADNDKDRFLKELAVRYCLAKGVVPFVEVVVRSSADLSDTVEVLTDIDVLGIESAGDGGLRRTLFDCKSSNKMSSINRAFWAAGVKDYAGCNEACVILKSKAVHNHRISALTIGVDLHDERSFRELGQTADPAFPAADCYQSEIARWNSVYDCYAKNRWADPLFDLARNITPLTRSPSSTFRRKLAELRSVRGNLDPANDAHIAIFLDILASAFVLWAAMGRDIRRFYEPSMNKAQFETVLKYYLWGGRDSYNIRQQMRERSALKDAGSVELPSWDSLVSFAGLIVSAPQSILECTHVCRELSIRVAAEANTIFDKQISQRLNANTRIRQFSAGLADYLVAAGALPGDLAKRVQTILFES
jgi:hypothetical protein